LDSTTIEVEHKNETLKLKTFRGELESALLEHSITNDIIYNNIMDFQKILDWDNRGKKVLELLVNKNSDIICLQEYDVHK